MIEINQQQKKILSSFLTVLINNLGVNRALVIEHAEYNMFDGIPKLNQNVYKHNEGFPESGKWDLILANIPLGRKGYIFEALNHLLNVLSDKGFLIANGEPLLLSSGKNSIRAFLEKRGYSLLAVINAPDGLLLPYTRLRTPYFVIKKSILMKEFIGELTSVEQSEKLANNLIKAVSGANLEEGVFSEGTVFDGFIKWRVRQQIDALETEYKNFHTVQFNEVLKSVNTVPPKNDFIDLENCVYIHKIGSKPVTSNLDSLTSNHNNFYQCVCDEKLVDATYLESFFSSKLGELILSSLNSGSFIPNITTESLRLARISIPPLKAQKEIVSSISKLKKIKEVIGLFENDIAVNPISSEQTLTQLDHMLEVVGGLADSDKVISIIRGGESKQTEFKESLSIDVKKQTKEKYIEISAIKTIAAFMNSSSGTLIVGVNDGGEITGVDQEIEKFYQNRDNYLLKFRNLIKEKIGAEAYEFIDYRLVRVTERYVLLVECKQSPQPIYVDDKDFYVRTNPATDKLDGPKMVTYIRNHFEK